MPTPDTEAPVRTRPDTDTPVRENPFSLPEPDRFYQPERLCPDQSQEAGWTSRP